MRGRRVKSWETPLSDKKRQVLGCTKEKVNKSVGNIVVAGPHAFQETNLEIWKVLSGKKEERKKEEEKSQKEKQNEAWKKNLIKRTKEIWDSKV